MNLFEQINNDIKQAMRDKNKQELSVLRMLLAALKNKKIDLGTSAEFDDEIVISVLKSENKKRKDSIKSYLEGNRDDLAKIEKEEMVILEKYLPAQMSDEDLEKIIKEVVEQVKAEGMSDFGKVMGVAMSKTKGQADGDRVSAVVKKILS